VDIKADNSETVEEGERTKSNREKTKAEFQLSMAFIINVDKQKRGCATNFHGMITGQE
jgi:hypothetical protein